MLRVIIIALFFGSGLTGLVYQLVWTKLLTLTFGVTLMAVSTVLTSFFGGLALGSYLGGLWIDRYRNCFFWYGIAEAAVGVYALVFTVLLSLNNSAYVSIARSASLDFYGLSLLKFALSAMLLLIPTTLMGSTLPILSKALADSRLRFAKDVGGLYAVNTLGAVAGTIAAAFFLIPSFGIQAVLYAAAALNLAIGAAAVFLSRIDPGKRAVVSAIEPESEPAQGGGRLSGAFTKVLVFGFALSGFTGLAYEVVWTRILGFLLTGTIYAFAAVLAVFLCGIALGSLVFSRFLDRIRSQGTMIAILAAVEILIGLSSIGLIIMYDRLPSTGFYMKVSSTYVWSEFLYLNFLVCFVTLIIPAFLFGATFPLVSKVYSWKVESIGTKIGTIYCVNTVGGIAGSFAGGFILIPFVGMQNTIILTGAVNIVIGLLFIFMNPFYGNRVRYAFAAVSAVAAAVIIYRLPANMPLSIHRSFLTLGESVVFYKEGAAATVMIAEREGKDYNASNKRLWVNGNRATAAYYEGLQINRFQGVLPMVMHPDPQDVLVICFGSGTTFGTLSQFPVRQVDNVEIAETVIKGAPYFKNENRDVLHNPRSKVRVDDGRSYLAAASKKYDVITEEPMHPALSGVVNLYTKEYYELARAHLKPGGIMSQWIPLYNLTNYDVKVMVRTFQSVFPHTTIWIANTDIFMIGSPEKTVIDFSRLKARLEMPDIKSLLKDIDLEDPYEFLTTFMMNEDMVRAYAGDMPVMGDDMPIVEFTGPRSLHINTISPDIAELLRFREPVTNYLVIPADMDALDVKKTLEVKFVSGKYNLIGRAYYADRNYAKALDYFNAALQVDPADRNSLHYRKRLKFF